MKKILLSFITFLFLATNLEARPYFAELKPEEKEKISFIVQTLGKKSLLSLGFKKGKLKKAGNAVAHVHPLRWMQFAMTEEKTATYYQKLRKRDYVWGKFWEDMEKSLQREAIEGEMSDEVITAFAKSVGAEEEPMKQAIRAGQWATAIDLASLAATLPNPSGEIDDSLKTKKTP